MLKVPVLGLYGGKDTGIPLETVNQIRDRLQHNSKSDIIVYPDAPTPLLLTTALPTEKKLSLPGSACRHSSTSSPKRVSSI